MQSFYMNGYLWHCVLVRPNADILIDRTGARRIATTDARTRSIYISQSVDPGMRKRVILHELAHVAMLSYGLIPEVEQFTIPSEQITAEEWVCNFIADYGHEIFEIAAALYALWR